MTVSVALFGRELLLLVITAMIGAPVTVALGARFDGLARLALAPLFGICIAAGLFETLEWFVPASRLALLVPAFVVVAAGLWLWLRRGGGGRVLRGRQLVAGIGQIALVTALAVLPASTVLVAHQSVGPTAYLVYDSVGYLAETDALRVESLRSAAAAPVTQPDMVRSFLSLYAKGPQEFDITPLSAAINSFVGLSATDTQSGFLIVVMWIGALAAWAAIRALLGRRSWLPLAGALVVGGPFGLQLFFDGSQAALAGFATLIPLSLALKEAVEKPGVRQFIGPTVLLGGLVTLYPVFLVPVAGAVALCAAITLGTAILRRRPGTPTEVRRWLVRGAVVAAVAAAMDPVGFIRDLRYWKALLESRYVLAGFPGYHLGIGAAPSWLLQTRGLYAAAFGPQSPLSDPYASLALPLLAAALIACTAWRIRAAWFALSLLLVASLLGTAEAAHNACGYCEERNLLPTEPMIVLLLTLGFGAVFAHRKGILRLLTIAAGTLLVVAIGHSMAVERTRFSGGSYFLGTPVRSVLDHLPKGSGVLDLEGFGEGPEAPGEEPMAYELAWERTGGRVSIAADVDDRSGLAYFGVQQLSGPWFRPDYRYVLTRIPGVDSGRTLIASAPGVALERRADGPDATVDAGVGVPVLPSENPTGSAEVGSSLTVVAVGDSSLRNFLRAVIRYPVPAVAFKASNGETEAVGGDEVRLCAALPIGVREEFTFAVPPTAGGTLSEVRLDGKPCR